MLMRVKGKVLFISMSECHASYRSCDYRKDERDGDFLKDNNVESVCGTGIILKSLHINKDPCWIFFIFHIKQFRKLTWRLFWDINIQ